MKPRHDPDHSNLDGPHVSDRENLDMKKLLVNAQVTAIFSVVEVVGINIAAITSFFFDSPRIGAFLFRIVENVLLPYLYLLKTQENRDKVVQLGLKRGLKEIFDFNAISLPWKPSGAVVSIQNIPNNHGEENRMVFQMSRKNFQELDVESLNESTLQCNLNVPLSGNVITSNVDDINCQNYPCSSPKNKLSNSTMKEDLIDLNVLKYRSQILDDLHLHVDTEMKYLQLFTRFNLLEDCKYRDDALLDQEVMDNEQALQRIIKISNTDPGGKRVNLRSIKIKELKSCLQEEELFQKTMNELIDIEENLLNDEIY